MFTDVDRAQRAFDLVEEKMKQLTEQLAAQQEACNFDFKLVF